MNRVEEILARLNVVDRVTEMALPGYRLHPLKGDLQSFWSVTVTGNWRIIFRFEDRRCLRCGSHQLSLTEAVHEPHACSPHPGRSIKDACLEPLGLTVTEGAKVLGVTRATLSNLINGRAGVSPAMAIRLAKAFGGSPETWLKLQMQYDLAQALKHEAALKVRRVTSPAA